MAVVCQVYGGGLNRWSVVSLGRRRTVSVSVGGLLMRWGVEREEGVERN